MAIDEATRTQVILAAVGSAGPVGDDKAEWNQRVTDQAVTIAVMLGESSSVTKALEAFERAGKPFPVTILGGRTEHSSTRVIVLFRNKDGENEEIRTDRTDGPEGTAMSNIVRALVGHKVLLWKEVETYNGGQGKVRVIRHVEDLGVDVEFPYAAQPVKSSQQRQLANA